MYICICTYIHTYIHTCIHTYIHTYIYTYIHIYIYIHSVHYTHRRTHTQIHIYIYKLNQKERIGKAKKEDPDQNAINLSSKVLATPQKSLLAKGSSFIPTPSDVN